MDAILNNEKKPEDDYYVLLGCDELSTTEQINAEYKFRVLEVHPDKHPDDPRAVEKFQKIQRARETLTDEKLRHDYDLWRRSGLSIPYETWSATKGSVHMTMHWAMKKKKEPMLEDGSQLQTSSSSYSGHGTDSSDGPVPYSGVPSSWSREKGDDILQKFRSYQV
ncbi:dnaJ homolog subfamily C member 12-like [Strongylocentrotus purpuratus]|uniref:J domain-containing protein n=1 Tax=Strongylocentrotus purpuratus TaxID=7668 RepID=A0A7M7NG06_STRPU|nr:dnaJ homolog subfamily C member 12-like [Strongylocentrotus purpuratus]